jgi:integrase
MASLQVRNGVFNCIFRFQGKRHWMNLGAVTEEEASTVSAKVDYFLLRLKQRLLEIPEGCDIVTFIQHDGKPPSAEKIQQEERTTLTLAALRDQYLDVHGNGTLEDTTLAGIRQHFKHWVASLTAGFPVHTLGLSHLQSHVDRRSKMKGLRGLVSPGTIKKEIITLRTCWNWGVQFGLVAGKFPNKGLRYAKMDEKPPFQTIAEVERRIAANGLSKKQIADLWDAVFLTVPEVTDLLAYVQKEATLPWIHPMLCFAAYTGARRSEIIRAKVTDVDFGGGTILINEKKRVRGERTTRRVPLTKALRAVLTDWLAIHPGGETLFCHASEVARSKKRSKTTGHKGKNRPTTAAGRLASVALRGTQALGPLTRNEAHNHLKDVLAEHKKWGKLRGFHVFRHSFASNCAAKGIDQRILDSWLGHTTEIRKRYLHLVPSNEATAIGLVFD